MKIAIVTLFFYPVQPDTTPPNNFAKALKNHQVTVLTQNTEADGTKIKTPNLEIRNNIKIIRSRTYGKLATFGKIWFPKLNQPYDIIHCVGGYRHLFSFIAYFKRKKAKFILSPFYPMHPKPFPFNILAKLIDLTIGKYLIKHADLCIAETNQEKNWLKTLGAKRIEIIPNPVQEELFKKVSNKSFKNKYKIKNKMIFCLGNHTKIKNFEEIIKAVKDIENVTLVIGGEHTAYTNELKTLVNDLGINNKIIFPGFMNIEKKREAYASSDLFVLTSIRESLGIVLLEAMAQGKPVIASNTGGISDVVPDPYCLYTQGNVEELKNKIKEVLNSKSLSNKLSKKGKEKAINYKFENVAKKYTETLEKL